MRSTLREHIEASELAAHADTLVAMARDYVRFSVGDAAADGRSERRSRVGGAPDLPDGVEWPRRLGEPLTFLVQLDMAELGAFPAAVELPGEGLLSVFLDERDWSWGEEPGDEPSWRVLFFAASDGLPRRREPPADLPREMVLPERTPSFRPGLSLPSWCSFEIEALGDEEDLFAELAEELTDVSRTHQVLGHFVPVQLDMTAEVAEDGRRAFGIGAGMESTDAAREWRLLLQLDSDRRARWCWGDGGALYFFIHRGDLEVHRFDRVRMYVQSH